jgi:hypothetical protein
MEKLYLNKKDATDEKRKEAKLVLVKTLGVLGMRNFDGY